MPFGLGCCNDCAPACATIWSVWGLAPLGSWNASWYVEDSLIFNATNHRGDATPQIDTTWTPSDSDYNAFVNGSNFWSNVDIVPTDCTVSTRYFTITQRVDQEARAFYADETTETLNAWVQIVLTIDKRDSRVVSVAKTSSDGRAYTLTLDDYGDTSASGTDFDTLLWEWTGTPDSVQYIDGAPTSKNSTVTATSATLDGTWSIGGAYNLDATYAITLSNSQTEADALTRATALMDLVDRLDADTTFKFYTNPYATTQVTDPPSSTFTGAGSWGFRRTLVYARHADDGMIAVGASVLPAYNAYFTDHNTAIAGTFKQWFYFIGRGCYWSNNDTAGERTWCGKDVEYPDQNCDSDTASGITYHSALNPEGGPYCVEPGVISYAYGLFEVCLDATDYAPIGCLSFSPKCGAGFGVC